MYFLGLCLLFILLEMVATKEDMEAYRIPVHARDYCAHILIPLNVYVVVVCFYCLLCVYPVLLFYLRQLRCRKKNLYMPWACEHEKHNLEVCMYEEYERRRGIKKWLKENNVDYKKEN